MNIVLFGYDGATEGYRAKQAYSLGNHLEDRRNNKLN